MPYLHVKYYSIKITFANNSSSTSVIAIARLVVELTFTDVISS